MAIIHNAFGVSVSTVILTSTANGPGKNNGLLMVLKPGVTAKMQRSNNNKNSKSQPYQSTDQTVVNIDASYDALPDKTPWVDWSVSIADEWQACANCEVGTGPKKLFRVVNLNRIFTGIGYSPVVPTDLAVQTGQLNEIQFQPDGAPGSWVIFTVIVGDLVNAVCTSLCNQGQNNPTVVINQPIGRTLYNIGTAEYAWAFKSAALLGFDAFADDGRFQEFLQCICGPDGQPGPGITPCLYRAEGGPG